MVVCPKCGYERQKKDDLVPDYRCPRCDVVYAKFLARQDQAQGKSEIKAGSDNKKIKKTGVSVDLLKLYVFLGLVCCGYVVYIFSSGKTEDETSVRPVAAKVDRVKKEKKRAEQREESRFKNEQCLENPMCFGKRLVYAQVPGCEQFIEKSAKYRFKWTSGWAANKFKLFVWLDDRHGAIVAGGDSIQLENGFGAFENYSYHCFLSVPDGKVLDLKMTPGYL